VRHPAARERRLKVVERSAIVPYSAQQMYDLVNDVAAYPQFLPWCRAARIDAVSPTEAMATIAIARGMLRTEFTTRNLLVPGADIAMHLLRGPFKNLTGHWQFSPIGARGSRVGFRVEFEFKNALTAVAFNPIFEMLCGTIVEAFTARARQIYA